MNTSSDQKTFYNSASEFYDEMISFTSSLEKRREWFAGIVNPAMKKAADLGCGSGLDSIALSQIGLEVTGFDISEGMISRAKRNAELYKVNPAFMVSEIHKIDNRFHNSFDLVSSLGNTIANIEPSKMPSSLSKVNRILLPGGKFIMQILNYAAILNKRERIISINKTGRDTIIRFYDFLDDHMDFNILKFDNENPGVRSIITTTIYPYLSDTLKKLLNEAGFTNIRIFGSLKSDEFNEELSKDLFISAEREM